MESADETTNNNGPCFDVPHIIHGHWPKNNKLSPKTKQWVNTQKQNPHFLLLGIEIDPVYRATQNWPPPTPGDLDVCALRRHAGSFFMELWGSDVRSIWTTNSSFISIIFYNYLYDIWWYMFKFYVWCLIIQIRTEHIISNIIKQL